MNASELARRLIRNFHDAPRQHEQRDPLYETLSARLGTGTAARQLGCSVDTVPPGKRSCPYHVHHAQEEMFVVIAGSGSLRVAGEMLPLRTGDVIFIPAGPEYPHQIVNTSDAPLTYLSIGTRQTPEICEYPDSGKYSAAATVDGRRVVDAVQRDGNTLDYWDGEP